MLYQINDGTVSLGGNVILDHIDFEIRGTEKIAVTGANGAGKTTLLQVLSGELELDGDDKRMGPGITMSRRLTVGMLKQGVFTGDDRTVEEELLAACPCKDTFERERFEYEQEYDRLFTGFGLKREDKKRLLSSFSGGEKTKIALIRLLLEKPDILILDEPTNHLDIETTEWLEQYLKQYEKAVVMVSHDRFFLDRTAEVVYELEDGHLTRYPGNYTHYKEEKRKNLQIQKKAYEKQQEEIRHLEELIEKFKHKPTKASFARSRKKILERMPKVPKPSDHEEHIFTGELTPAMLGSKWVFESEHLKIGYDRPVMEITMRIKRGQKIGILGKNGVGKTTTVGKLAGKLKEQGKKVVIAGADTFRAAAGDQLKEWADRSGVDMIGGTEGADPGSVVYDATAAAKARNADVLLVDTAGRLHNKKNLMNELGKINKILEKEYPQAYRETLVVLDATTGQNALVQAKEFSDVAKISGIVLTKMDGTAKGGIAVAIQAELGVPVKYIGVGETIDDLQKFDPDEFVNALFDVKNKEDNDEDADAR